jgi:DNA-binding FrmR family transcriptional regulator
MSYYSDLKKADNLYKKIDRLKGLIEGIQEIIEDDESEVSDNIKSLIAEYQEDEDA